MNGKTGWQGEGRVREREGEGEDERNKGREERGRERGGGREDDVHYLHGVDAVDVIQGLAAMAGVRHRLRRRQREPLRARARVGARVAGRGFSNPTGAAPKAAGSLAKPATTALRSPALVETGPGGTRRKAPKLRSRILLRTAPSQREAKAARTRKEQIRCFPGFLCVSVSLCLCSRERFVTGYGRREARAVLKGADEGRFLFIRPPLPPSPLFTSLPSLQCPACISVLRFSLQRPLPPFLPSPSSMSFYFTSPDPFNTPRGGPRRRRKS